MIWSSKTRKVRKRERLLDHLTWTGKEHDVILSCAAIHNIYSAAGRDKALREIARVLKPGGCALIDDIRHIEEYTEVFHRTGCSDVQRIDSRLLTFFWTFITMGSLRPGTIIARKILVIRKEEA